MYLSAKWLDSDTLPVGAHGGDDGNTEQSRLRNKG